MWWAARAEDGRGPATALAAAVAAHFVLQSAMAVAESVHLHRVARERLARACAAAVPGCRRR